LDPEVFDGNLLVLAAVGILTTSDEVIPSDDGEASCCLNALLNLGFKIFDDFGPDFRDFNLDFG
jgi:hypothetical protein